MQDIEFVVLFITKLYIIMNAQKLGWKVETVRSGKIVLVKNTRLLTKLDCDTPSLIDRLFSGEILAN